MALYGSLNNLVFYSSLWGEAHKSELLEQARVLMAKGKIEKSKVLLLTACRAILMNDGRPEEKKQACDVLELLWKQKDLTERERKEVKRLLDLFCVSRRIVPLEYSQV
jgi:hypothetical protein